MALKSLHTREAGPHLGSDPGCPPTVQVLLTSYFPPQFNLELHLLSHQLDLSDTSPLFLRIPLFFYPEIPISFRKCCHGTCRIISAAYRNCPGFYCPIPFLSFHLELCVLHPLHLIRHFHSVFVPCTVGSITPILLVELDTRMRSGLKSVGATSAGILSFLSRSTCMRQSLAPSK